MPGGRYLVPVAGALVLEVFGGYNSGWPETVIMRFTDILIAFAYILLAIAITGFPIYTRLVRGMARARRLRLGSAER